HHPFPKLPDDNGIPVGFPEGRFFRRVDTGAHELGMLIHDPVKKTFFFKRPNQFTAPGQKIVHSHASSIQKVKTMISINNTVYLLASRTGTRWRHEEALFC